MKQKLTIVIPASIPRLLTPNRSRRAHWGQVAHAKKQLQLITLYSAIDARNRWLKENPKAKLPFEKGLLWFDLVIKDRRSILDDDNAIAGLKFCRDMLQNAGIIKNDRNFLTAKIMWTISKERAPLIIIKVEGK